MLEDLEPPVRRTPCKIRTILDGLSENDQRILLLALEDVDSWSGNSLARALSQRGLLVTEKPIRKHRNNECSCK